MKRRVRRRSSGPSAAPLLPLLLLLLFLLAVCLSDIATLASAQSEDGDASSFDDGEEAQEARPSPPSLTPPSIDDLAPGAVVSTLRGSPRWKVLPDLFVRRTALVECEGGQVSRENTATREHRGTERETNSRHRRRFSSTSKKKKQDFRVFVARDAALLAQAIASGSPPAWCGWRRAAARAARGALRGEGGNPGGLSGVASRLFGLFGASSPSPSSSSPSSSPRSLPPCEARLPTFGPSAVAVVPRGGAGAGSSCRVEATRRLDPALAARLCLGAALFLLAAPLAASASFRVSAGAVSFALASLLVVLFLVARAVPNKRQLAVAAAAMGSGALTVARLLFGHWVPTLSELASAKVLGGYAACSLAVGAAVAFWFDDPGAAKAHAILAAALRLAGLGLVAGGVSSPAVGLALAGALALAGFAGPGCAGSWAELRERRRRRKGKRAAEAERRRAMATTGAGSPPRRQASPLFQQQQQQRSPEAALRQRRRSSSVSTEAFESPERSTFPAALASSPQGASRGGGGEEQVQGGLGRSPSRSPVAPLLSFLRRPPTASPSPARVVSAPRPTAPLLVSSAAAVPLPSAHEEEEVEREEEREDEGEGEESADQRRRTTTTSEFRPSQQQQQSGGWQREREEPQQRPAPLSRALLAATASAATSTPTRGPQHPRRSDSRASAGPLPLRSPLVDRGLLLNEATGKTIKIGAATYNRLVLEGYTVDEGRGTLSPPARARKREGGGGGGGGVSSLRPRTRNG